MTITVDPAALRAVQDQSTLEMPMPPTFASVADERRHRLERLAGAFRLFGKFGFGEGVAGHITARDPEFPDHFWVNPFGVSFRHIRVSDLILVNHQGEVVIGSKPVNRAAFVIHSAIHAARPEVIAACHAHSVHGKAWSALGRTLDPITQDACAFYEDHVVCAEAGGLVALDEATGKALAAALGPHKAVIHQNHGNVTVGQSVDEAAWWFITMERTCQAQLLAEAAGTPKQIPHEWAASTRDSTSGPFAGWFNFQPLWDEIRRAEPDFLD
jgi:ribulose-5-phosphate 4-epimerase/fuculose-1-phosphate aldolase